MQLVQFGILAAFVGAMVVAGRGMVRFARRVAGLTTRLQQAKAPVDVSIQLPDRIREFALRADARPDDLARSISFSQSAEMQLGAGKPWQAFQARQIVACGEPGFLWQARQMLWFLPKFQVVDAFVAGQGSLTVRLLGLFRIVHATGPALSHDEALRYLAELPLTPDAMLGNPDIKWRALESDWVEASMLVGEKRAVVRFGFDVSGDIVEMRADSRATTDNAGSPARYPWLGFFRSYRRVGPRRIPTELEVGYIRPDGYRAYFQARITGYEAEH